MVGLAARRGHVDNQSSLTCSEQKGCRMPTRDVVCAKPDSNLVVPNRHGMIPKAATPGGR